MPRNERREPSGIAQLPTGARQTLCQSVDSIATGPATLPEYFQNGRIQPPPAATLQLTTTARHSVWGADQTKRCANRPRPCSWRSSFVLRTPQLHLSPRVLD